MRSWLMWPVLAAVTLVVPGHVVLAQEGTPAAGGDAAAICSQIEPRDAQFFAGLDATPAAAQEEDSSQGTPVAEAKSPAQLEGDAVDEATIGGLTDVYQHLVACLNDGDYLRAYALYTDDYLVRNLSAETIGQLEATPVPVEESTQSEFRGVIDARVQDDGRIVALVMVNNPQSGDVVIRSTLNQVGDRLRIDDESVVEALDQGSASGSSEATPTG